MASLGKLADRPLAIERRIVDASFPFVAFAVARCGSASKSYLQSQEATGWESSCTTPQLLQSGQLRAGLSAHSAFRKRHISATIDVNHGSTLRTVGTPTLLLDISAPVPSAQLETSQVGSFGQPSR